ncbi:MAG: (Fe-S)-binding protein [Desulfovibrionaceae bacterium]|nr:(Fe-S)-binding protein [Desulfovibrionaceae bacterium]
MIESKDLKITDVSTVDGQMVSIDIDTLPKLPIIDEKPFPWKPFTEEQKANTACILDDVCVLNIPMPKTHEEEEELVNKFLTGMRKLFKKENNWTFLPMLETSMDTCVQCNSCSEACHLYECSGQHEMYRPNYRSEIFRRIYKQYVKKEPLAKWRYGDMDLNWKTVARLAELSYRCNLCRRCAQVCPIGVDNGLLARELRKLFSQEMGIYPPELHQKGTMNQLKVGSSTGMTPNVVQDNVSFIDEDYSEITGVGIETPFDKEGADIMLIHNAGEIMAWPENIAAFSLIFNEAGLSWTLSSDACAYDGVNYGVFYDDAQTARLALAHMQAAKKLGVKKIVIGECGHAHKALTVIADRVIPYEYQVPRESCYVTLRDIVMSGKLKLDPSRNNFPVTLHDPCNIVRLMGIVEPQREILRKIAPMFREMPHHGVDNFCCGGGSGFAIMTRNNIEAWRGNISGRKKFQQICAAFADCMGPETKKYICAPCSNCKGQIREILEHNDMYNKHSFAYAGLVELIVNCMENVKPGFIHWECDEEE